MAANKDDAQMMTTWLPSYVNDADMSPENPLEHTDGHYLSIIYLYTNLQKMEALIRDIQNTTTADVYIASQSIGGTSKKKYKILDRPWRVPRSKLKSFLDSPAIGGSEIVCVL